ncbi:snare-like protein [Daldinia caldariorum]|uniref:snare-like protein n=1 Tax=Daldinia caldariorum TaxID=326644 RepID=UPI0020076030|nr:snare-like protein [Daldinia caldariorum]KAI1468008.1 snare-like protein [Daldinia caldariorum]
MATTIPSIACLGVIGRNNNPLHITIFPSYDPASNTRAPLRTPLQFSLLLSSTLDIFDTRARRAATTAPNTSTAATATAAGSAPLLTGDFGLLHAVDERLAAYGFETNTGVKFVAVVDMRGRYSGGLGPAGSAPGGAGGGVAGMRGGVGLRETELRVVFRAMQTAYVRLLQNPFYDPDEHAPLAGPGGGGGGGGGGVGGKRITSHKFAEEMRRIGEGWAPGVTNL